jgi:multicomponent Na+:H+ antiporter subunit A
VLALRTGVPRFAANVPVDPFALLLCCGIMLGAVVVTRTASRLTAIAALGIIGFGMSLIYVLYGAPDLAMTQFVIEVLTVVLFVLVLHRMPQFTHFTTPAARVRDLVVSVLAGAFMSLLVIAAIEVDIAPRISNYYVQEAATLAHGRNIVNTILVDFRALDTLGELVVLSIAALGAFGLLRLRPRRRDLP